MFNFQCEKVGRAMVVLWTGAPTIESSSELSRQLSAFSKSVGGSYISINIISVDAQTPNSEERKMNISVIDKAFNEGCQCMHSVVLGDSLRIAVIRALMRGVGLASKHRANLRVFATVEESIADTVKGQFAEAEPLRARIRDLLRRNNLEKWI